MRICEHQGSMIESEEDCKHGMWRKKEDQCSLSVCTFKISKVFSR